MMELVWLVLVLLMLGVEIISLGLVSIWFMCGALVAFFVALAGGPEWLQIVVFIVVSILTLISLRPFAKKFINDKAVKTNVDSLIGKRARVTERIDNVAGTGRAVVGGMEWMARSLEDSGTLEENDLGIILRVEGVKLIVEKERKE